MHGSNVYKPFGMRNGGRVNNIFILDARQPCIDLYSFLARETADVRIVVLSRMSSGSRVYNHYLFGMSTK